MRNMSVTSQTVEDDIRNEGGFFCISDGTIRQHRQDYNQADLFAPYQRIFPSEDTIYLHCERM